MPADPAEFLGMAIAYLHVSTDEFYNMRPGVFFTALNIWLNHEMDKQRFTADLMRMQTTDMLNIQLKKKDRIKPDQLWSFPWDVEEKEQMTADEIRKMNDEILKKFEK